MRYCYFCRKAMYTSNHSTWIKGKNYDAHKGCIEKSLEVSLCEGCCCATHTLPDGKCGKCGFIKVNNNQENKIKENEL